MNNESRFALRFVVKNVAEMKKAVNDMNKNLQKLQNNANRASAGVNKLNTSFGKTIKSIGKFAIAYFALSKMMSTTFKKINDQVQLDMMAASAGVAAEKIGKLGKALRIYGGDAKSAGNAYMSLTDIIGGATHGRGISEDVQRVNAMFGIGFNYGNISQDQLMTNIAVAMNRLKNQGDTYGINQIAKAYGLDNAMANFLAEKGAGWSSERNRQEYQRISKTENQRLIEAQEKLNSQLAKLGNELIPLLQKLVNGITIIAEWINNKVSKIPETAVDEQGNTSFKYNKATMVAGKNGVYTIKDKQGNVVYSGNKFSKALEERDKLNREPSKIDRFFYGIRNSLWGIDKRNKEIEEFNKMKEKYESVPGQTYTRNWLTGETRLSIDLDVVDKTNNGIKVNNVKSNKEVQVGSTRG